MCSICTPKCNNNCNPIYRYDYKGNLIELRCDDCIGVIQNPPNGAVYPTSQAPDTVDNWYAAAVAASAIV